MKWSGSTCNVNIEGLSLRNKKDRPLRKRFIYQKKSGIYSLYSSSNSSYLILLLQKYILYTDTPPPPIIFASLSAGESKTGRIHLSPGEFKAGQNPLHVSVEGRKKNTGRE